MDDISHHSFSSLLMSSFVSWARSLVSMMPTLIFISVDARQQHVEVRLRHAVLPAGVAGPLHAKALCGFGLRHAVVHAHLLEVRAQVVHGCMQYIIAPCLFNISDSATVSVPRTYTS